MYLAGGITGENVGQAISSVRPFGIDVCTGVRTRGALDRQKLRSLVGAMRGADG